MVPRQLAYAVMVVMLGVAALVAAKLLADDRHMAAGPIVGLALSGALMVIGGTGIGVLSFARDATPRNFRQLWAVTLLPVILLGSVIVAGLALLLVGGAIALTGIILDTDVGAKLGRGLGALLAVVMIASPLGIAAAFIFALVRQGRAK